jgi:uncharacterized protein
MARREPDLHERIAADDRLRSFELCTNCGLCCTGALHDTVNLEDDEVEHARQLGLPIAGRAKKPAFHLPCPKLCGSVCSIYEERPLACARYRCGLLQRLQDGTISLAAAKSHVQKAKSLIDRVKEAISPDVSLPEARRIVFGREEPRQRKLASANLRLAVTAAALYIDQHFRNSKEGTVLSLTPVEDEHEANV